MNASKKIMLTGATGYVGGWIAKKLMEKGYMVHAPIRSPENAKKTKYLDEIESQSPGTIKYFKADLLEVGSYDEAMQGCDIVIHTASPFISKVKNPQKDLVDPAVKGTENVLNSVNQSPSVKKVVLTSSCAAIYGDAKDLLNYTNQTMTEADWNTTSSLTRSPYNYSKVMAEKKAWEMYEQQRQWQLVVLNPALVIGPGINPYGTSESFSIVKQFGDGRMKMGCPDLNMGCVDVRDVADAHLKAAFQDAEGRHILLSENVSFIDLAAMLRPRYGKDYPLPKKLLPKWLMWLLAPISGVSRQFVRDNVGYPWKADNRKSVEKLGMEYIPIKQSINEFFQQLIDANVFK